MARLRLATWTNSNHIEFVKKTEMKILVIRFLRLTPPELRRVGKWRY